MRNRKQRIFLILLDLYTIFIWFWILIEFISKGSYSLPSILATLYILVLTFYASDKEIRRWRGGITGERRGEFFVFLWILSFILIVGYYLFFGQREGYEIPRQLPSIAGAVMVIYVITDYLKKEFKGKR